MKMIRFGDRYYEVLNEFIYPINNIQTKEYILRDNISIIYYRLDGAFTKSYDINALSKLIIETENLKFRNPNIKENKLKYLGNIKQIMREYLIDDVLKEEFVWQFA